MSFVKLHGSILHSSIWLEPHSTRIVWITMLAMADQEGIVGASMGGLAHAANVTREECAIAVESFLSPDEDSRTSTHEGRRIERVAGGWLLLNHAQYRDRQTDAQIKGAARARKHREKRKSELEQSVTCNEVTPRHDLSPTEAEAEAEAEKPKVADAPVVVSAQTTLPGTPKAKRSPRNKEHPDVDAALQILDEGRAKVLANPKPSRDVKARALISKVLADYTLEDVRHVVRCWLDECANAGEGWEPHKYFVAKTVFTMAGFSTRVDRPDPDEKPKTQTPANMPKWAEEETAP